jgi:DNA polymerase III delta subunit
MDAKPRSRKSPTRSSAAPFRAGSPAGARATRGIAALLERWDAGTFAPSAYFEGPSEAVKGALLVELKAAWARKHPGAPRARVFRGAESGIDQILAAFQSASLFSASELVLVLDVEDLGRSDKRVEAFASGIASGGGESVIVLVESAAETPRKSLEALRAACAERFVAMPLTRTELTAWARRRFAREAIETTPAAIEVLVDACEGDSLAFFNELDKLCAWAGIQGKLDALEVGELLRPVVGADLPEYLSAVALGDPAAAARRLGRLLSAGVGEGTVLFALSNLVGGALGGWARYRVPSESLRRRVSPAGLDRSLDAVYRAEAAWKGGRADIVALLEQTTRSLCGAR